MAYYFLAAATLSANAASGLSDAIVLDVEVDGISDLYAFQIDLQFDPP